MLKENSLILKNSSILFFRLLITSIIGLLTSRYVIQSLGASDFGLYNVVGGVVVMMAFFNLVMTSTTYRFIAFEIGKGDFEGVNRVFNISLVIHVLLAVLVLLLTETVGVYYVNNYLIVEPGKLNDALFVLRFSTYATVFTIVSIPFYGLLTAQENFSIQAIIDIVKSVLGLIAAIVIIYYLGNKIRIYAFLIAIVNLVPIIYLYIYSKLKYSKIIKWSFQKDKSKYKEMVSFSAWMMLGAGASIGQTTGSALIINVFFGTVLNAAYGIAIQINSVVSVFARNLGQAAIPQMTKSFSSGKTDRTITLATYISKYTMFLIFLPALPVLLETKFLLKLWLGSFPPYTLIFSQLMIVNALIGGLGSGLPSIVQATGKIKYFQIVLSITSLLSLPIGYVLFNLGFAPSAIIIAFISTGIINIFFWQILLKRIIDFDVKLFIKISYLRVFYVALLLIPVFFIKGMFAEGLIRFISISTLAVLWLIISIYFVGLEKEEKAYMKQIGIKLKKKFS